MHREKEGEARQRYIIKIKMWWGKRNLIGI